MGEGKKTERGVGETDTRHSLMDLSPSLLSASQSQEQRGVWFCYLRDGGSGINKKMLLLAMQCLEAETELRTHT